MRLILMCAHVQLEQYDSDPKAKAKRDKKYVDRDGYETWLKSEIVKKIEAL